MNSQCTGARVCVCVCVCGHTLTANNTKAPSRTTHATGESWWANRAGLYCSCSMATSHAAQAARGAEENTGSVFAIGAWGCGGPRGPPVPYHTLCAKGPPRTPGRRSRLLPVNPKRPRDVPDTRPVRHGMQKGRHGHMDMGPVGAWCAKGPPAVVAPTLTNPPPSCAPH